jgi:type IV pilus assembly protein PilQ
MDVDINKDAVGVQTTAGFAIDTKHVKTSVLVENGDGGDRRIYTQRTATRSTRSRSSATAAVGPLFRTTIGRTTRRALVFLTPRIIDDRLSVR